MIRRRGGEQSREDSSSEEEEDAFSALSRKSVKRQKKVGNKPEQQQPLLAAESAQPKEPVAKPVVSSGVSDIPGDDPEQVDAAEGSLQRPIQSLTSSMKRHHKPSDLRKAKMDALLQELEAEKKRAPLKPDRFVPEKKGSFVDPAESHLTTNIFVGNLDPSIGEEELTDLFLQFGDLYSVKIMWPRTPAERSRNRNTGFVCFMNREDAEEAMEACNEADPFNVGRRLMMRWGKNVKKIVKRGHGTGGVMPILRKTHKPNGRDSDSTKGFRSQTIDQKSSTEIDDNFNISSSITEHPGGPPSIIEMRTGFQNIAVPDRYQADVHRNDAFVVEVPSDKNRFNFISRVAFFVSKDGSHFEKRLIQRESQNPKFSFLILTQNATEHQRREHIFYRWRVYAFCQGDGFSTWRTEPFVMFHPYGRFWIPPALDKEAALLEEMNERNRQEMNERNRKERRRLMGKREYLTGRQIERARDGRRKGSRRGGPNFDGGTKMSSDEMEQFDLLVRKRLSVSRKTICEAMAFCFEQSRSAKEISELIREVLMDASANLDTRIARLYLLSDILFNSQQPGVKNAFLYRDAIEKMAPDIFTSLGRHGGGNLGRMTMNKLRTAVSSVLAAWTDWSVYNPAFMDELEARFEGREIEDSNILEDTVPDEVDDEQKVQEPEVEEKVILDRPRGDWKEVNEDEESSSDEIEIKSNGREKAIDVGGRRMDADEEMVDGSDDYPREDGAELDSADGDPLGADDVDGECLDDNSDSNDDVDGTSLATNQVILSRGLDGKQQISKHNGVAAAQKSDDAIPVLNDPNVKSQIQENGEDLRDASNATNFDKKSGEDEDLDGEPVDGESIDGESIDGESIDGESIDGESIDGEAVQVDDLDGEAIDGEEFDEDIDGEAIDGEEIDDVDG